MKISIGFLPVLDAIGLGLTEVVLQELKEMEIPIEDMRSQGYNNGTNMKKNFGIQKKILGINPRAFYVP